MAGQELERFSYLIFERIAVRCGGRGGDREPLRGCSHADAFAGGNAHWRGRFPAVGLVW